MHHNEARHLVAEIINPAPFRFEREGADYGRDGHHNERLKASAFDKETALAKADAILSLLSASTAEGDTSAAGRSSRTFRH